MKKRMILIILAVPVLAALTVFIVINIIHTNEYNSHPVYNTYDKGNNHQSFVMIDGIEYKAGCALDSNQVGDMIGFLNDKSCPIYKIKDDINKNFLYVTPPSEFKGAHLGYYRSDFIFPKTSADTVNKFYWWDSTCQSLIIITDLDIIKKLFEMTNDEKNVIVTDEIAAMIAQITLLYKDTPGFCLDITVCVRKDGRFYCGFFDEGNIKKVKISAELLERIAGHKINIDEKIISIIESEKNLSKYE